MFGVDLGDGARLRPLEPWQAEEFLAHGERARPHIANWIPWATTVTDVEKARTLLRDYADRQAADTGRIYGIWVDGVLRGGTVFRTFDTAVGVCEVGVWLEAEAEGRGLVTRAVRHMIDWAVGERGMVRVEWRCAPDNLRSQAVAKRLGMRLDGTLRQSYVFHGERRDEQIWSLLADEWR
ncbi:GNAT family protein [Actinomadura miaoliensis]|uniref:GNAT family protein n=1 Tax=Actinomadura miaoliensis TaxID=430685 RepID=A0ABP7VUM9_9ACTN